MGHHPRTPRAPAPRWARAKGLPALTTSLSQMARVQVTPPRLPPSSSSSWFLVMVAAAAQALATVVVVGVVMWPSPWSPWGSWPPHDRRPLQGRDDPACGRQAITTRITQTALPNTLTHPTHLISVTNTNITEHGSMPHNLHSQEPP